MIEEGMVSMWVGKIHSNEDLNEFLKISYTDDGGLVQSKFGKAFKIRRYDDNAREAEFYEEKVILVEELLRDYSYDDVIIPKFKDLVGEEINADFNAVILLYNFKYDGSIKEANGFKFIGATYYE